MRTPEAVAAMPCPVCKVPLAMSDRQGIEIDYCPNCRGIWLDRGELDKIIERSAAAEAPQPQQGYAPPPPQAPYPPQAPQQPWGSGYGQQGHGYHGKPHYKKRKSFFEELFD